MKIFSKNGQSGFSLVELMIVVGIIGVLATLALPRFKQFQSKAKMAEALNVLQHLYTLEQSYAIDNNVFIPMAGYGANLGTAKGGNQCNPNTAAGSVELGFVLEPCVDAAPTPRFRYTVASTVTDRFSAEAQTGGAANNRVCPGNGTFTVRLSETNAPSYAGPATGNGQIPIHVACPQ